MCSEIMAVLVSGHYPVDTCLLLSCHEKTRQKEKWILLPLISQTGEKLNGYVLVFICIALMGHGFVIHKGLEGF